MGAAATLQFACKKSFAIRFEQLNIRGAGPQSRAPRSEMANAVAANFLRIRELAPFCSCTGGVGCGQLHAIDLSEHLESVPKTGLSLTHFSAFRWPRLFALAPGVMFWCNQGRPR